MGLVRLQHIMLVSIRVVDRLFLYDMRYMLYIPYGIRGAVQVSSTGGPHAARKSRLTDCRSGA